jgi:hypothetical protein
MSPEQREQIRAAARRAVADFRPLTPEQVARVVAILRPVALELRRKKAS